MKKKSSELKPSKLSKIDVEVCIIHCIAAKLELVSALQYMKSKGHKIEKSKFYKIRYTIIQRRTKFGHQLAKGGLFEQHMIRIENLEEIEREYWVNYHKEPDYFKKSMILEKIQNIQPFISSAYDYIKEIMLEQAKLETTSYAKEPQLKNTSYAKELQQETIKALPAPK